jgi:hypothetical protein
MAASTPAPIPAVTQEAGLITIRQVRCAELLNAAEDDRAAGSTFLLGYEAARLSVSRINVSDVEGMETAALDYCAAHADRPAVDAFARVYEEMKR